MSPTRLGRYELLGEIGRGAMGIVYRARDPLIERTVAIKTFSCAGLGAAEVAAFEQRFFREAKLAGGLSHPNIVTVHDVGRDGGLAYIAMEYLAGRSLRELLDSGVVLPPERAAEIAAQVADGLAFAHGRGVVHRDVKPANIMVLEDGTAKLADFGVALLPTGASTLEGTVFGSPKYMSPEQVAGNPVDGRSDIFSLGAVLYEMLTGGPPFSGEELTAILYQVLHGEPPAASSRRRNLDPAFDRIVARALAKEPADRYQSAADFAAALRGEEAAAGDIELPPARTVPATGDATIPLASVGRLAGTNERRPRSSSTALLLALPLVIGVGAWLWLRPAPPAAPSAPPPAVPAAAGDLAGPESAHLQLAITPWGEVYVDGQLQGSSPPLRALPLTPGRHVVEIRNGGFPVHRSTLVMAPRAAALIKHKFE